MAVQFTDETIPVDWDNTDLKIPEGEQRLLTASIGLFCVEYVQVFNRHRQDGCCSIYGEITCCNEDSNSVATLFKRSEDDPHSINLADPYFQSLTISDDGLNAPPCIYSGCTILVKVKLFEKKQPQSDDDDDDDEDDQSNNNQPESVDDGDRDQSCSSKNPDGGDSNLNPKEVEPENEKLEEEDNMIADLTLRYDDFHTNNKRFIFEFEGNSGFVIHVAHFFLQGCFPVAVRITINDEEGQGQEDSDNLTGKRKRPIDIYGVIAAIQEVGDPPCRLAVKLLYKSKFEPGQVSFGSPIHLDRTFFVAPVCEGHMYISYTLYRADNNAVIADDIMPFPIPTSDIMFFVVDKDLCHTRKSKDGRISISLEFLSSLKAVNPSNPARL